MKPTVLVTGATGYIGRHCADHLSKLGYRVIQGSRTAQAQPAHERWVFYRSGENSGLRQVLEECQVVVHCAGLNTAGAGATGQAQARIANVDFTRDLAKQSLKAGVQHFIHISSAMVLAGSKNSDGLVCDDDKPSPMSAYAVTKCDGERVLEQSAAGGLRYTILRPPMVYGPASRGNFSRISRIVQAGLPLPLANATAAKSFIFAGNLASAVAAAVARTPAAANRAFLVSDGHDTSTADLVREISRQLDKPARMFGVPHGAVRVAFSLLGLRDEWDKLTEPFVIDARPFMTWAEWSPPVTFQDAIRLSLA